MKPQMRLSLQSELLLTSLAVNFIDFIALFQILFIYFNIKKLLPCDTVRFMHNKKHYPNDDLILQ